MQTNTQKLHTKRSVFMNTISQKLYTRHSGASTLLSARHVDTTLTYTHKASYSQGHTKPR